MIRMRCQCGKDLKLPGEHIGKLTSCPRCERKTRIIAAGGLQTGATPQARLIIRSGPGRLDEQVFPCGEEPMIVGRSVRADFHLGHSSVDIEHCRLLQGGYGWRIENISRAQELTVNGRLVNGRNLLDGDVVLIGNYELEYIAEPPPRCSGKAVVSTSFEPGATDSSQDSEVPINRDEPPVSYPVPLSIPISESVPPPIPKQVPSKKSKAKSSDDSDDGGDSGSMFTLIDDDELDAGPPVSLPVSQPQADPHDGPECPSCKRILSAGSRICVQCGIDIRTGRPIITSHDSGMDDNREAAEGVLVLISWIIWFGIYPIASEAFGTKKPHVIRAITVLTIIISCWFFVVEWGESPSMQSHKNLMLWAGDVELDPEILEEVYFYTSWGDSQAYLDAKDRFTDEGLSGDECVRAAHDSLNANQKCVGSFSVSQLFSHAFLHGDPLHLLGNMLFLLVFGSRVNALIGNLKTIIVYPVLAVGAAIAHVVSMNGDTISPCVGASGAIMGLAGMYFVLFPIHKVHMAFWFRYLIFCLYLRIFSLRGFWVVLFFIGFDVFYTIYGGDTGTAHWAHLGGFIVGVVIALILLLARNIDSRGGDIFSVILGRRAWAILGRPHRGRVDEE